MTETVSYPLFTYCVVNACTGSVVYFSPSGAESPKKIQIFRFSSQLLLSKHSSVQSTEVHIYCGIVWDPSFADYYAVDSRVADCQIAKQLYSSLIKQKKV